MVLANQSAVDVWLSDCRLEYRTRLGIKRYLLMNARLYLSRHNIRSVSGSVFGHFVIEVCYNFLPIVYPLLIVSMGLRLGQIGVIAFVQNIVASLFQPAFGYLSDRWSPSKLAAIGVLWGGVFLGLVGLAENYAVLLLVVAMGALGSAAFHPAGAVIASMGVGKHKGAVLSFFTVGGALGAAVSPIFVAAGLGWLGLRGTSILIPIGILAGLVMYWQLGVRSTAQSEESGAKNTDDARMGTNEWLLGLALVVLAIMCRSWFYVSFVTYLPTWMQGQGGSLAMGGKFLFAFTAFLSGGSLLGGVLSDRIGRWQVVALGLGLLCPAYWYFLNALVLDVQLILLATMGILVGLTLPASIVMAQEVWSRGVGLASALVIGLGWVPGGIGAAVTGLLADKYSLVIGLRALLIAPIISVVCMLAFVALRRHREARGSTQTK